MTLAALLPKPSPVSEMLDVDLISARWTDFPSSIYGCRPYAVCYSFDGQTMAFGGGGWHGDGFLCCRWPDGHELNLCLKKTLGQDLAVTALTFSPTARHLFVGTRGPSMTTGPILVFKVLRHNLEHLRSIEFPDEGCNYARGFAFCQGKLLALAEPLRAHSISEEECEGPSFVSSGLVAQGDRAWSVRGDKLERVRFVPDARPESQMFQLSNPFAMVTEEPAAGGLVACSPYGDLVAWYDFADESLTCREYVQIEVESRVLPRTDLKDPRRVECMCPLGRTGLTVTASRCGRINLFRRGEAVAGWWLPDGSPRAMAASPSGQRLVVACKGTKHPGVLADKLRNCGIDPETQSVREGRLFEYAIKI